MIFLLAGSVHIPKLHLIWEFIKFHLAHYFWNFFSCPKVFYIMSECPLDWIHPLVSARNYYGYLHPGCYPRSSAWWHSCACLLYQSELLLSQLFQQILWQSLQILVKAVETPPTPKRLWSFQCLRAKPLHYNFQRGPIFDIQLATSFLKRKRYIRASSYNLIWIIIYHLWWCTCARCIRAYPSCL